MTFSPWGLFVDLGAAAILLLAGQLLRSRVSVMQRLFLPASVIGGLMGLALGPNGIGILKLSDVFSTYPGILIALIFASLPFASEPVNLKARSRPLTNIWAFSTVATLLQWGAGVMITILVLRLLWPDLNPGFGAIIASGFVGGHGTAAAVGAAFHDLGWPEAGSLAMTSATVGILSSVVGGMIWVKWGSLSGQARYITRFHDLPEELRTGLVAEDRREWLGQETVSSNSIDSLAFHFCLICCPAAGGYLLSTWSASVLPQYKLPVFCLAYIVALFVLRLFRSFGAIRYVDRKTIAHIGGSLTDILVVFGIASIKLSILVKYALPLTILFVLGILLCCFIFRWLGPGFFQSHWFEKSLFTWGWITGVTAMGMALLRIVDPKNESGALNDFGLAYLFIVPVELGLVTLGPQIIANGHSWFLAGGTIIPAIVIIVLALRANRTGQ